MELQRKCVECMWSKLLKPRFDIFSLIAFSLCIIFCSAIVACSYTSTAQSIYKKHTYPETGIIIETISEEDTVVVECANGNRFSFFGIEDYVKGDIVAMIMHDKGTSVVYDDEIIKTEYAGYTDLFLSIEKQSKIK